MIDFISSLFFSIFYIALFSFGIAKMGIWLNWLSLPWIDGWGIIFIDLIPIELIAFLWGSFGSISILGYQKVGRVVFLVVLVVLLVASTILVPNITDILFWRGEDGEKLEELVKLGALTTVVGASKDKLWLSNNPTAKNISYSQLLVFLKNDDTDSMTYSTVGFVCADFAERLHNNAEKKGIRCAFVAISLTTGKHALNMFNTTDKGLIYVDCTNSNQGINCDASVNLEIGRQYIAESLFPTVGWSSYSNPAGTVNSLDIIQW